MNSSMQFYIAAVVNASQYRDGHRMIYVLGARDSTTDADDNTFYNREISREYSFFYRVFSASSTSEVYYYHIPAMITCSNFFRMKFIQTLK